MINSKVNIFAYFLLHTL